MSYTKTWLSMLLPDTTLASIHLIVCCTISQIKKLFGTLKKDLIPFPGVCWLETQVLCLYVYGVHYTNPVEKKTANGIKRKVKEEHLHYNHYLDALKNFQSFVCKQNLMQKVVYELKFITN